MTSIDQMIADSSAIDTRKYFPDGTIDYCAEMWDAQVRLGLRPITFSRRQIASKSPDTQALLKGDRQYMDAIREQERQERQQCKKMRAA